MVKILQFRLEELCQTTQLSQDTVIEMVEQGIIEPIGDTQHNWIFTTQMITVAKKAYRLHRDLEIDWSGIALAIDLIDELEQLREENERLYRQLNRFIDTNQ